MISTLWISQTALRFADHDLFTMVIICCLSFSLMLIMLIYKGEEERVTGWCQNVLFGILYICTLSMIWNKTSQPQKERNAVIPKKANKKPKENLPPVIVENQKKKQKKGRRNQKKSFCKENTEPPPTAKKETKMFSSWDICGKLNRDPKSIYDQLHKFILSDIQLRMNHYPRMGCKLLNEVPAENSDRKCVRCQTDFTIYNGLYLSDTKCNYHPKKAMYVGKEKWWPCCNSSGNSPGCTVCNTHVTQQHRPRPLTQTSSRRHVRRDLQHSVYALDCEMSYTTEGLEVVRVGLVNLDGLAVYDGYVKPRGKILDYNTMYSGVDQTHLQNVTVTLDDVKQILSGFIYEDTILVGHALNNDLAALGLVHNTIVDTSVLFADPRIPSKKIALKTLVSQHLGLSIQDGTSGHDSTTDARATLQLALLKVPMCDPSAFPEQSQHQSAPKQRKEAETRWEHQQPLMEVQNFDLRYDPGVQYLPEPKMYVNCDTFWRSHVSHMSYPASKSTWIPPWSREGY